MLVISRIPLVASVFVVILSLMMLPERATAQASCSAAQTFTLDWDTPNARWPAVGALNHSVVVNDSGFGAAPITTGITISGRTNRLRNDSPDTTTFLNGGIANDRSLQIIQTLNKRSEFVTTTLTFSRPVSNLTFRIHDVDRATGFRDWLRIRPTNAGVATTAQFSTPFYSPPQTQTTPSTVYIGAPINTDSVVGNGADSPTSSNNGTLIVTIPGPADSVAIRYGNGPEEYTPEAIALQGISLHDLVFCDAAAPMPGDVQAAKTVLIHAPDATGCDDIPGTPPVDALNSTPGACVQYTIALTNVGAGTASNITLTDVLPSNLEYRAAAISGFPTPAPTLNTPAPGTLCNGGACEIVLSNLTLAPNQSGSILVRGLLQ